MITNEPKKYIGEYAVDSVRSAYENRGRWLIYLVKEGLNNGLSLDFAKEALREAGKFQYKTRFKDIKEIDEFTKEYMTYAVEKANEGVVVEQDDKHVKIELGYCPLVAAWTKLDKDETIYPKLCDCCLEMERGMAAEMGWIAESDGTIGAGCGKCTICFKK